MGKGSGKVLRAVALAMSSVLGPVTVARADTVTLNNAYIEVEGWDGGLVNSYNNNYTNVSTPTSSPQKINVSAGASSSSSNFAFDTNAGFHISFDQIRSGSQYSYALAYDVITFTVGAADTAYSIGGSFTGNPRLYQYADLSSDGGSSPDHLYSYQETYNDNSGTTDPLIKFNYLGNQGNNGIASSGSLTGTLLAGHTYSFVLENFTHAYPGADQGGSAYGDAWITFNNAPVLALPGLSPDVATTPLPSTAWAGLGLLGCVGGAQVIRRRKVAAAGV